MGPDVLFRLQRQAGSYPILQTAIQCLDTLLPQIAKHPENEGGLARAEGIRVDYHCIFVGDAGFAQGCDQFRNRAQGSIII